MMWKKQGIIFNPSNYKEFDWMYEFAQAPSVLIFDHFIRVYFSCRPRPDKNGQYVSYSSFVDLDRKNLFKIVNVNDKPILELGSTGCFDEFGIYPISTIIINGKVYAYYGGWTRCESVPFNVAIGAALSEDNGVTFKKLGMGPVLSYSPDEPFILSGPKIRYFNNQWILYYISGKKWILDNGKPEPVYRIRAAVSNDGVKWVKCNKDIIQTKYDDDEAQASPDVIYKNGKYHMFFCYRKTVDYRCNKNNTYRIGYAYSFDNALWERDDSLAGIDISTTGWDSEMISYPHVFELDGQIIMFYLGNQVGRQGFGMAVLEGDLN